MSRYDNMMVVGKNMEKIMVAGAIAGAIAAAAGYYMAAGL